MGWQYVMGCENTPDIHEHQWSADGRTERCMSVFAGEEGRVVVRPRSSTASLTLEERTLRVPFMDAAVLEERTRPLPSYAELFGEEEQS